MRTGFYFGLAKDGIRKNRKLYMPYIIACVAMVALFTIIVSIQYMKYLNYMMGGGTIREMMNLGSWVIALFSCVFLFYTNSFLMKKRKKEFGLYHILGMGKRHISRILFWENVIVAVIGLLGGILFGGLLSKLAELGLVNIMKADVSYEFYLVPKAYATTLLIYGALFFVLFLNAVRQIRFASTVSLIASEKTGEKPPKANWLFGLIGVVLLAVAYIIAIRIKSPISALLLFFLAVILVIIGTYLLFISSSVVFCKLLQKNKKYYYQTNHFISVSSMIYRMKRNGAGLASICILATMVLVMISSTSCLYFGVDDVMDARYPRDINMQIDYQEAEAISMENVDELSEKIFEVSNQVGGTVSNTMICPYVAVYGNLHDNYVKVEVAQESMLDADTESILGIYFESIESYNRYTGENMVLNDNEAILYSSLIDYDKDSIELEAAGTFQIVKKVKSLPRAIDLGTDVVPTVTLFVNDIAKALGDIPHLNLGSEDSDMVYMVNICFDNGLEDDEQAAFINAFRVALINNVFGTEASGKNPALISSNISANRDGITIYNGAMEKNDYFSMIGGLFYLGIILSVVFVFATVLIIYYKQISEGFEDQTKFEIMQKVGMTKKEIRKSINSQMLTVFFFPLLVAGVHICFAFPIIRKLLLLFQLNNVTLFAMVCLLCFAIFAAFYMIVYKFTSNAYFKIVSGANNK